ncbi:hypothetical protein ACFFLM_03220 [Deinococcus oregonensis]|uniref:Uncharacterized protein n=1 Tax=Deinococcus oregonensis TaxID=1805970 RepID=A0ABV6AU05_9DEIO
MPETMTATEARAQIRASTLDPAEQQLLLTFVGRFPDEVFMRNTEQELKRYARSQSLTLPQWFSQWRLTMAECASEDNEVSVQFSGWGNGKMEDFERARWYSLSSSELQRGSERRKMLRKGSQELRPQPLAEEQDDPDEVLLYNLGRPRQKPGNPEDPVIYRAHLEDLEACVSSQEDIACMIFPAFSSVGELLSRVARVRRRTRVIEARLKTNL